MVHLVSGPLSSFSMQQVEAALCGSLSQDPGKGAGRSNTSAICASRPAAAMPSQRLAIEMASSAAHDEIQLPFSLQLLESIAIDL